MTPAVASMATSATTATSYYLHRRRLLRSLRPTLSQPRLPRQCPWPQLAPPRPRHEPRSAGRASGLAGGGCRGRDNSQSLPHGAQDIGRGRWGAEKTRIAANDVQVSRWASVGPDGHRDERAGHTRGLDALFPCSASDCRICLTEWLCDCSPGEELGAQARRDLGHAWDPHFFC